jgi:hypothetical protein
MADAIKIVDSVLSGSNIAMKMVQEYLNKPSLAGVLIHSPLIKRLDATEISEQMILDSTGGRKAVSDNFAIKPIVWTITGYLKAEAYEMSSLFQPSLKRQFKKIEDAKNTRSTVTWKDSNSELFQVGIESCETRKEAGIENVIPIDLVLKQCDTLTTQSALVDKVQASGTGDQGSDNGTEIDEGSVDTKKSPDSEVVQMFGGGAVGD